MVIDRTDFQFNANKYWRAKPYLITPPHSNEAHTTGLWPYDDYGMT
jgi:hypothetical protein